jgi:hypothetical protein
LCSVLFCRVYFKELVHAVGGSGNSKFIEKLAKWKLRLELSLEIVHEASWEFRQELTLQS